MSAIAVVIPFYQREAGILGRALDSVLGQTDLADVTVHVVDDGSPVDPAPELAAARARLGADRVALHRKPNGGPGSARNHGLERVHGAEVVAFLDSDDRWSDTHLAHVRQAMASGADLFFADHIREGSALTRFAETGFAAAGPEDGPLHEFAGDLFGLLLDRAPVGTSTVAYRYAAMPDLRFEESWRAGEDIFFFMNIALRARRTCFSTECEARYGRGVNIFAGYRWGTAEDLVRTRHMARYHMAVHRGFRLTPDQVRLNLARIRALDRAFMTSFVVASLRGEPGTLSQFRHYARARPRSLCQFVPALGGLVAGRVGSLFETQRAR